MDLKLVTRCRNMMAELGIPVTRFCQNINLSTHSYYLWVNGKIVLSDGRTEKISNYLKKYGF